jgi:hypothetical protein
MKSTLLVLMLLATPFALGQQISCAKFDEQQGQESPKYTMKGCRSFNELQAAGGIKIVKEKGIKNYSCFATVFPEEGRDLFIFASLGGVISFSNEEQNGFASMETFMGGVSLNRGYTLVTWTQYPKANPFLWSEGNWHGHGDAQMKDESLKPESNWKRLHIPRLHASVEGDTVQLRLEINNDLGAVETLDFNRRTGRALLNFGDNEEYALRCIPIEEQN